MSTRTNRIPSPGTPKRFQPNGRAILTSFQGLLLSSAILLIPAGHLLLALAGTYLISLDPGSSPWSAAVHSFCSYLQLSGTTLFSQLFISGIFLYAMLLALRHTGIHLPNQGSRIISALALSVAISVLLAADSNQTALQGQADPPESLWSLMYIMLTEHQALVILSLLIFLGVAGGVYYVVRSLFSIHYEGSGVQIRLPGQTVYYVPVYPQVSWQKTGILLKKGETVFIEISGYVSPGALQEISELQEYMNAFVNWQKEGAQPDKWIGFAQAPTWKYTGPEGYQEEWYGPDRKLGILRQHPIYSRDYFYREDELLTIKGLPHNRVVGIIVKGGDPEPRVAHVGQPAYDWAQDREKLLDLSSSRYPLQIEATHSGELWVVINDVDVARWDNGGMFFLKLTRNAIL